jgi:hypothetical protein
MSKIGAVALNATPRVIIISDIWIISRDIGEMYSLALDIATWG